MLSEIEEKNLIGNILNDDETEDQSPPLQRISLINHDEHYFNFV